MPDVAYSTHQIDNSDGFRLKVLEWGRGATTCLAIHGLGDTAHVWNEFSLSVTGQFRVVAPDLRGHGDSGWDQNLQYQPSVLARDLFEISASLKLNHIILIGHSLGAEVAIRFAVAYPRLIRGIVIVDFSPETDQDVLAQIHTILASTPRQFDSIARYTKILEQRHPLASPSALDKFAKASLRTLGEAKFELKYDPRFLELSISDCCSTRKAYEEQAMWRMLTQVKCPTLVIRGAGSSVLSPVVSKRMITDVFVNAKLITIQMAGHCVMLENPGDFKKAVVKFLNDIQSTT